MGGKITIHVTRDGEKIPLEKLSDEHLSNILKCIENKADEGMIVGVGGLDPFDNEPWFDEEEIEGQEALSYLHYDDYRAEFKRRTGRSWCNARRS